MHEAVPQLLMEPDLVIGSSFVLILTGILVHFWVMPWLGQAKATNDLHLLRNELYRIGDAHPPYRDTLLYRDVEWLLCVLLFVVRGGSWTRSAILMAAMTPGPWSAKRSRPSSRRDVRLRLRVYNREQREVFVGRRGDTDGYETMSRLLSMMNDARTALAWHVVLGHPVLIGGVFLDHPGATGFLAAEPPDLLGQPSSPRTSRLPRQG